MLAWMWGMRNDKFRLAIALCIEHLGARSVASSEPGNTMEGADFQGRNEVFNSGLVKVEVPIRS